MFSFSRRRRRSQRSLLRRGILAAVLVALAPVLYMRVVRKRSQGAYGLREAYPAGSEWSGQPSSP